MTDHDLNYTDGGVPWHELDAAREYSVFTVIPYSDGPEYREYMPSGQQLPALMARLRDPEVAETVIKIEPHY
jgi:hypothetical protein